MCDISVSVLLGVFMFGRGNEEEKKTYGCMEVVFLYKLFVCSDW